MTPLLLVLDDLTYILECAVLDYMGEGKTELDRLCDSLENDVSHANEGRAEIAALLRAALAHFRTDEKAQALGLLSQVNLRLWYA